MEKVSQMSWKSHGMSWNLVLKVVWDPCSLFEILLQHEALTTDSFLFMGVNLKKMHV